MRKYFVIAIIFAGTLFSCKQKTLQKTKESLNKEKETKLFESISSEATGISFINNLVETENSNYYQYMYTYIGGGVASGDINNDGLIDLFFVSNVGENKLYLNKGDLIFEDITASSKITNNQGFHSGISMVDVNNDGFLDIYISRGGWDNTDNKFANLLYVNNQNNTFTEKAEELGIADANRTIQTTFFDFDNDNDLDAYVSNSPDITSKSKVIDIKAAHKDKKSLETKGSDRFYENDGTGHFTDISNKAGLVFDLGFGLNPQVGDFNNDGWLDVYVSNDFESPDLLYLNNKDKTFTESFNKYIKHSSYNSMGGDIADINNDGLPDLMTLDMNPQDYFRSKTTMGMTSISKFELMVQNNYNYQYMHNMLQLSNGNGTFSEVANLSGIANTDWSWSTLFADFDLDGYNDVYVTNGVFREVLDRDTNSEILKILRKNGRKPTKEDFLQFTKMFPQQKLTNYFYRNRGDLTFENTSNTWVNEKATFSNGAVYADLDNDGDLDIVVNNINDVATVLKNNAIQNKKGNYLKVKLKGPKKNIKGLGAKIEVKQTNGKQQMRQLINSRGFLSSVSNELHFGFNKKDSIQSLKITWGDAKSQVLSITSLNQTIELDYKNSKKEHEDSKKQTEIFKKTDFTEAHLDSYFNDYKLQILLPQKYSQLGPALAKADVNNDGLEDVFIGGGYSQASKLLLSTISGKLINKKTNIFEEDKKYEDITATFFDADNDGDQDLYVGTGSYEFGPNSRGLQDRLYINDGKGNFSKAENALPEMLSVTSVVTAADYDNDGDLDLFIGSRVIPGKYPYAPTSYLLNNTNGKFRVVTTTIAPELEKLGMITDAVWTDINKDTKLDLIVTGEWMGIEVFLNTNGKLSKNKNYKTLENTKGWWNKITVADIDGDGDQDIIAGNAGLNSKFKASKEIPFHIYTKDFDSNGTEDVLLAKSYNGKQVPVRGKTCMTQQIPGLARTIPSFNEFANKDLGGILGNGIKTALHYEVNELRSGIFRNTEKGFVFEAFENRLQIAPINSILYQDFDSDGIKDILMAGNNHEMEVETTRFDAGAGYFLKGNTYGNFEYLSNSKTGFWAQNNVRNMLFLNTSKVVLVNNNDKHQIYKISK